MVKKTAESKQTLSLDDVEAAALVTFDPKGHIKMEFSNESDDQLRIPSQSHIESQKIMPEQELKVPAMTICIMIVGTRGDVQPFVAIGKRLQKDGHRVRLATHAVFRSIVVDRGLEFYPLAGDPKELAAYMIKTGGHLIPLSIESLTTDIPSKMRMIDEIINSTWPAIAASDPDAHGKGIAGRPFRAQAIISNPVTFGHIHVAEKLGIPLHIMFPQPWVPTVAFPHPLSNLPYHTAKPQRRNLLSYRLLDLLMWQSTERMINEFRKNVLGLRKIRTGDGGKDLLLTLAIPHAFLWSPSLLPKPMDWGSLYDVVGTAVDESAENSEYTPSEDLAEFLNKQPIYVGFGSMILSHPTETLYMIAEAAAEAEVCVLFQYNGSKFDDDVTVPPHIFILGDIPHSWLFPRVRAVVHHGGAGTTAAGLLAGKPTFITPFFGDQPLWGRAVVTAGVGVEPCPIAEVTSKRLSQAFKELCDPCIQERVHLLQERMQQENGVEEAVKSFYRHLPLAQMTCGLAHKHEKIAVYWDRITKVKLCDECAFVISERNDVTSSDLVSCIFVDYSARGPTSGIEGVTSGAGAFLYEVGTGVKSMFVSPFLGYRDEGPKGAIVGFVKGFAGMVARPFSGLAILADHIATGHYNSYHAHTKRIGSIYEGREAWRPRLLLGCRPEASTDRGKVTVKLTADEVSLLQNRFMETMNQRRESSTAEVERDGHEVSDTIEKNNTNKPQLVVAKPSHRIFDGIVVKSVIESGPTRAVKIQYEKAVDDDAFGSEMGKLRSECLDADRIRSEKFEQLRKDLPLPIMNICMVTCGSWEERVSLFVAIGLRLREDGHRVRIAATACHRNNIIATGLEFYPLEGECSVMDNFFDDYLTNKYSLGLTRLHRSSKLDEIKSELNDQILSYWPACCDLDSIAKMSNSAFRADVIVAHPLCFGISCVAERLGVPLHYYSEIPVTPTAAFSHPFDASFQLSYPYSYMARNFVSYKVITSLVWSQLRTMLDRFRASLGSIGKTTERLLWPQWRAPHTYLWNPKLLMMPQDWHYEVSIAGYLELPQPQSKHVILHEEADYVAACSFIESSSSPVVLVEASRFGRDLKKAKIIRLLDVLEAASKTAKVRILLSGVPVSEQILEENAYICHLNASMSHRKLLAKVDAVVHGGSMQLTAASLEAGKPCCIVSQNWRHRVYAQALVAARVGVELDSKCVWSFTQLASAFQQLISPLLQSKAKDLGFKIDNASVLENAVTSFYANLPIHVMRCDLDPSRLARVYDGVNELKLSYEAEAALQAFSANCDLRKVKYKPILYCTNGPPKFSIRAIPGYPYRICTTPELRVDIKSKSLLPSDSHLCHPIDWKMKIRPGLEKQKSFSLDVVNTSSSVFWASAEEEASERARINSCYELVRDTQNQNQNTMYVLYDSLSEKMLSEKGKT